MSQCVINYKDIKDQCMPTCWFLPQRTVNTVFTGDVPPVGLFGAVNDLYFDLSTGDVYRREENEWVLIGSVCCGPTPTEGLRHFVQPDPPMLLDLEVGDFWTDAANNLHYWNGSEWIPYNDLNAFVRWETTQLLGPNLLGLDLVNSLPTLPELLDLEINKVEMNYEYQLNLIPTLLTPTLDTGITIITDFVGTIIIPPFIPLIGVEDPITVTAPINYEIELAGPFVVEVTYDETIGLVTTKQTKRVNIETKDIYNGTQILTATATVVPETGIITGITELLLSEVSDVNIPFILTLSDTDPTTLLLSPNPLFTGIKALGEINLVDLFDGAGESIQVSNVSLRWFFPTISLRIEDILVTSLTIATIPETIITITPFSLALTPIITIDVVVDWLAGTGGVLFSSPADSSFYNSDSATLPAIPGFHELEVFLWNNRVDDAVRSSRLSKFNLLKPRRKNRNVTTRSQKNKGTLKIHRSKKSRK